MKLTKTKLKQIIKEEIAIIQNEGMMDKLKSLNPFGKKEDGGARAAADRKAKQAPRLLKVVTEDFLKQLRFRAQVRGAEARTALDNEIVKKGLQDIVDRLQDVEPSEFNLCGNRPCNPRNEGPRDSKKWANEIRDLAVEYIRELR